PSEIPRPKQVSDSYDVMRGAVLALTCHYRCWPCLKVIFQGSQSNFPQVAPASGRISEPLASASTQKLRRRDHRQQVPHFHFPMTIGFGPPVGESLQPKQIYFEPLF